MRSAPAQEFAERREQRRVFVIEADRDTQRIRGRTFTERTRNDPTGDQELLRTDRVVRCRLEVDQHEVRRADER